MKNRRLIPLFLCCLMAHHDHPYLLVAFTRVILLSHQFLLHSVLADHDEKNIEISCPSSFECGNLGTKLSFPFSNYSTYSQCGLFTISCNETYPAIRLANESTGGYGEVTKYKPPGDDNFTTVLQIYDYRLHGLLTSINCETFNNVSFPSSPAASVAISQTLTFLKCKSIFSPISVKGFNSSVKGFHSYNCPDFDLYYQYLNYSQSSIPPEPTHPTLDCSVIQLPMKPFNTSLNASNPFELLTANFSLEVHVPADCWNCHQTGGQCQSEHQDYFYCTKNDKSHTLLILATAIPGGLILICLLLFIIHRRSRWTHGLLFFRSRKTTSDLPLKPDVEDSSIYFGVPVFSYSELEEATNSFDPSKELGDGGFGTVYHGKLQDGREVAVKRLYDHNYKRVSQFMNEVQILTCLHHPNLVTLYGCTSRHSRELLLVYEYIPNGTVADHLHGDRGNKGLLTWPIRMNIAIETASALVYLHASDIIHRDVKTNNILLDRNFSVKVADFGLSRLFPNDVSHISTAPQGTPGYVDPEYHQCYQLTDKSDVYSFGVVLIELISSMPAVDICRHRHEINLANLAINRIQNRAFNELIDSSLGFESDSCIGRMTTSVAEVAFRCLQLEKEMRPTMDEVLEALKEIQEFKDEKF